MTSVHPGGRLGNQIIKYIAVSIIAEKFNLHVFYYKGYLMEMLGINLFSGTNVYKDTIGLYNHNYFSIYNSEKLESNLHIDDYYQSKEITNFIYKYLRKETVQSNIMKCNPFNSRYNTNNDLFISVRLGDVADRNPGLEYYMKTISSINFDNLYISSDEPNHTIIREIVNKYPNATILHYNPIYKIQFGSTCRHIILSHGTYSSCIGYLSYFSTIHYPEIEEGKEWHGDIFSIDGWIKHNDHLVQSTVTTISQNS